MAEAAVTGGAAETATGNSPAEPQPAGGGRLRAEAAAARTAGLFLAHHASVARLCRGLLRDPLEAEDACQQVFLSAHRALLRGSDPREPAAWLATIARNECRARIHDRMRRPLATGEVDDVAQRGGTPDGAARRAELSALVEAIASLPAQQRHALVLRELRGLSYGELADALDVSAPAVESLLFRARRRLRDQLRALRPSADASWLEAFARIFAGGGSPLAAKAVALGVGATALGGTAVVVPVASDRQVVHAHPAHAVVHRTHGHHAVTVRRRAPVVVRAVESEPAPVRVPPRRHDVESERHAPAPARRTGADGAVRSDDRGEGGGAPTTPVVTPATVSMRGELDDGRPESSHDGSNDPVDASTAPAPTVDGGSDDGGAGRDGGGGGHDGGSDGGPGGSSSP